MKKNVRGIHILLGAKPAGKYRPQELCRIAVQGGASVVQLREKELPVNEILPVAIKMREICRTITFIINDYVDLAKVIEADGVHLGQDDMQVENARNILGKDSIIGVSCGSVEEAKIAEAIGADYIGFGHMFPTYSKIKSTPPKSLEELEMICTSVRIPVIAIGGISRRNVHAIAQTSAGGIAVLGSFSNAINPAAELEMLMQNFHQRSSIPELQSL